MDVGLRQEVKEVKTEINEWVNIKLKALPSKRNQQWNKKTTNQMGEDIC